MIGSWRLWLWFFFTVTSSLSIMEMEEAGTNKELNTEFIEDRGEQDNGTQSRTEGKDGGNVNDPSLSSAT